LDRRWDELAEDSGDRRALLSLMDCAHECLGDTFDEFTGEWSEEL